MCEIRQKKKRYKRKKRKKRDKGKDKHSYLKMRLIKYMKDEK